MNKRIELLLKKKEGSNELDRFLELYRKLDDFLGKKPTAEDEIKLAAAPVKIVPKYPISFIRGDIYDLRLNIVSTCEEIAFALRDYYEKKIIELTEADSHEPDTATETIE
jgi:hypothetical protein